ncbi:uncharacterized protein I206_100229 [Kwoniella pini CBS 10737]|uniref:Uncharacterized protein n=1 Tax=Kwoniella pini CBS 10737 TaxID=1296096 RepID=A0A1B9IDT3_9TREE|nr:uncharacterized protein I206_01096 [Kwoniella pini CBS 10737]OCF53789.1 hypothetical protein I206_01096 [Kwoniella pini CBS 10737]
MAKKTIATEGGTSVSSPYPAGPSTVKSPASSSRSAGPLICFETAGGMKLCKKRIKPNQPFESVLNAAIEKIDPRSKPEHFRISHVRAEGREVDLIDEYDFESFQRRALDKPSATYTVKIYLPTSGPASSISEIPAHHDQYPQTPASGGSSESTGNVFETPAPKPKNDKKGKRKAADQTAIGTDATGTPTEIHGIDAQNPSSTLEPPFTPALPSASSLPDPIPPTNAKSSKKKRKQKQSEELSGNFQTTASSSSFDAPSSSESIQPLTTPSKKSKRKRKRDSEASEPPQADSAITVDTTSIPQRTAKSTSRERASKSPEKKRRKKTNSPQQPTRSSPALQINLSSTSSSVPSPYAHLNKYRPVTPSPLGRLPTPSTPSVDGEAEEELPETPTSSVKEKTESIEDAQEQPKTETGNRTDGLEFEGSPIADEEPGSIEQEQEQVAEIMPRKKSRVSKKDLEATEIVLHTPPSSEESVQVDLAASELDSQIDKPDNDKNMKTPKSRSKKKEQVSLEAPLADNEELVTGAKDTEQDCLSTVEQSDAQTSPIFTPDADHQPSNEPGIPQSVKKVERQRKKKVSVVPDVQGTRLEDEVAEDLEKNETPAGTSKRAAARKIIPSVEIPTSLEAEEENLHAEIALVDDDAMEVDHSNQITPASVPEASSELVKEPLGKDRDKIVVARYIPLSYPFVFHVRPNEPIPFITSRYNSSSLENRSAQKVYGQSRSIISVKDDSDDVVDDEAISLEEEEVAASPVKRSANARTSSKPTSIRSDLATMDTSNMPQHLTPEYQKVLQKRGQCTICNGPNHLGKDCPEVIRGPERLRELLAEKKVQKKSTLRNSSIEKIEFWIGHLEDIAKKVKGYKSKITPQKQVAAELLNEPVLPSDLASSKTQVAAPIVEPATKVADAVPAHADEPFEHTSSQTSETEHAVIEDASADDALLLSDRLPEEALSPVGGSEKRPLPRDQSTPPDSAEPSVVSQSLTSEPSVSPEPLPKLSQQSRLDQSPTREHSAPPIYLKALATKAGSVSGLSVSDAVIETGSSASESDDEEEDDTGSESEGDSDDGTTSTRSGSGSADSISRSPSPFGQKGASREPPSLDDFMSMPLSQTLKRRARQSAAGMKDVEIEEEIEEESDIESTPERQLPIASFAAKGRAGSESSVGEYADEKSDEEANDLEEDDVIPFTQPPDIGQAGSQPDLEQDQDKPSGSSQNNVLHKASSIRQSRSPSQPATESSSKRSFAELADVTSPSPIVADFPGSIALQEAIDEDDAIERISDVDLPARGDEGKTGHVISQGLMSPPSSSGKGSQQDAQEPIPATQLVNGSSQSEENTPRAAIGRLTRGMARQSNLAPPIDLQTSLSQPAHTSPPRRRHTRSMSREPTLEPPSPRVTTRRISSSQPNPAARFRSKSPSSNVPVRRSARGNTPSSQLDELASSPLPQPRRSSRRGTTPVHSSQVDQLQSSPSHVIYTPAPIPEEEESEADLEEAEEAHESTQQTPVGSKIPLVPATQDSEPRRVKLRSSTSNLFMSPGSQLPQTQAYNIYPNLPSSESGASIDETPKAAIRVNRVAESPLSAKKGNSMSRKSSLRLTSPIQEEEEERTDQVEDSQPHEESSDSEPANGQEEKSDSSLHAAVRDGMTDSEPESSSDESDNSILPAATKAKPTLRSSQSTTSLYPSLPLPKFPSSQPATGSNGNHHVHIHTIPTLSSLSKDALRNRSSFGFPSSASQPNFSTRSSNGRMSLPAQSSTKSNGLGRTRSNFGVSHSQPIPAVQSDSDSGSGSDSDSSEEEKTPVNMKNRISRGVVTKPKVKRRASQGDVLGTGW